MAQAGCRRIHKWDKAGTQAAPSDCLSRQPGRRRLHFAFQPSALRSRPVGVPIRAEARSPVGWPGDAADEPDVGLQKVLACKDGSGLRIWSLALHYSTSLWRVAVSRIHGSMTMLQICKSANLPVACSDHETRTTCRASLTGTRFETPRPRLSV